MTDGRAERPSARHQFTLQDHEHEASASRSVPVYVPAFANSHCAYPQCGLVARRHDNDSVRISCTCTTTARVTEVGGVLTDPNVRVTINGALRRFVSIGAGLNHSFTHSACVYVRDFNKQRIDDARTHTGRAGEASVSHSGMPTDRSIAGPRQRQKRRGARHAALSIRPGRTRD